ncbi:C1 family peptidase [Kocuria tytonicola]|uniref:C1 family peptidase n=1 Tax=Kocuria tytonicola TaxID=2055946 RepID=UPI000EF95F4A|nr:C1 family peptidase [Kocuria tytonicola]
MSEVPPVGTIDLGRDFGPVVTQGAEPLCAAAVAAGLLWHLSDHKDRVDVCVSCLASQTTAAGHVLTVASCLAVVRKEGIPVSHNGPCQARPPQRDAAALDWSTQYLHDADNQEKLDLALAWLSTGSPFAFQIGLYPSAMLASRSGWLRAPAPGEVRIGLHAVLCVGYLPLLPQAEENCGGAGLIIKNSWGPKWGAQGYGVVDSRYLKLSETGAFLRCVTQDRRGPQREDGNVGVTVRRVGEGGVA